MILRLFALVALLNKKNWNWPFNIANAKLNIVENVQ